MFLWVSLLQVPWHCCSFWPLFPSINSLDLIFSTHKSTFMVENTVIIRLVSFADVHRRYSRTSTTARLCCHNGRSWRFLPNLTGCDKHRGLEPPMPPGWLCIVATVHFAPVQSIHAFLTKMRINVSDGTLQNATFDELYRYTLIYTLYAQFLEPGTC